MLTLTDRLRSFKNSFNKSVPVEVLETLSRSVSLIQKQKVVENSLIIGSTVKPAQLYDSNENAIQLDELLLKAPLIISFIRGAWCPYCMLELQQWNEFISSIVGEVNFIAVSGETPCLLAQAKLDNQLDFPILVDKDYQLAHQFGLTYEVDPNMKALLMKWGIDLKLRTCLDDFLLPIPATYIINKHLEIKYAFLEEDYTERAEPQKVYNEYKKLL